ncbi:MAG: signal peptidase II [Rhodospirillaceae bacterium]|nr:signal peptidase II [Rhodospirillaceae bacterium]
MQLPIFLRQRSEYRDLIQLGFPIAAAIVVFDQATKFWMVLEIMSPPRIIEVTSFFNLVMVWNRGVSFGLFSSISPWTPVLLGTIAVVISMVLALWMYRARSRWLCVSLALVIAGALGNAIDRVIYGAVADFLDFHAGGYHWPAFNVADIAISMGVVMLLFDGLIEKRRNNRLGG